MSDNDLIILFNDLLDQLRERFPSNDESQNADYLAELIWTVAGERESEALRAASATPKGDAT